MIARTQYTKAGVALACIFSFLGFLTTAFANEPTPQAKDNLLVIALYSQDKQKTYKKWLNTSQYLSKVIPGFRFEIKQYTSLSSLEKAIDNKQVHFVLTDPVSYVTLELKRGIARISTLVENQLDNGYTSSGITIFTRTTHNTVKTLSQLKHTRYISSGINQTDIWWMQLKVLFRAGIYPRKDFRLLMSEENQSTIVHEVLNGNYDAGAVRTGVLEKMARQNTIRMEQIRVLSQIKHPSYPFLSSSRLYPSWPFSKVHDTPDYIAEQVAIALIQMPSRHPAALVGGYYGWTVPLDYTPIHELMKFIKIGPYSSYGNITLTKVFSEYWHWILIAIGIFATVLIMSLRMRMLNKMLINTEKDLKESNQILQEIASRDSLTQLSNRRKLDENLEQEWWRACREQKPISALIVDLDYFKEYNDANGHLAGDHFLVKVADSIQTVFKRSIDIKARYGGDEFVIVLPNTSNSESDRLSNELLIAINGLDLHNFNQSDHPVSASIGVATITPKQNSAPDSLIAAADAALYISKDKGRARIERAP